MTGPATVDVLGTPIDNVSLTEATDRVVALARSGSPHLVVTANVDHLMTLRHDVGFRRAYDAASLRLADGAPLLAVSRLCRTPLAGRVTGADLMPTVAAAAERHGLRVFVLGGTPEVAAAAAARLRSLHPALVLEHSSPPLGFDADLLEDRRAFAALRAFRPDIVFVCLGAPRSEKWAASHLHHLGGGAVLCVGAAVDFVAGAKSRAPTLIQRLGLEWAYRLAQEPGRLWRRYLLTDSRFLALAAVHVVRRRAHRHPRGFVATSRG
jgi:N-acetylglucosaminyldiphosphoundecaprenol N-acetyl-beta-D-mannosaminyltransferase